MQTAEGLPSVCQHAWQLSQWIYSCWICTLDPGQEAQMTCCKGLKSDSVTYMKLNLFIGFNKTFKTWHRRGNKEGNMSCKSAGCASCSLPIFLFGSWEVLMLGFAAWCHLPVSSGHLEVSYIYIYTVWGCWSEKHTDLSLFTHFFRSLSQLHAGTIQGSVAALQHKCL